MIKRPAPTIAVSEACRARIAGTRVQAVEGNPLTDDEVEMFEILEREGWRRERRVAHMLRLAEQVQLAIAEGQR